MTVLARSQGASRASRDMREFAIGCRAKTELVTMSAKEAIDAMATSNDQGGDRAATGESELALRKSSH